MIRAFDKHTPQGNYKTSNYTYFDRLGTVLNPMSAYINQELNGVYNYEITCPILEDDDSWKMIKPYNIIKSSTGQLFQINKVVYALQSGIPTVKAYAPHIWYYLADMHVNRVGDSRSPYWAMLDLFSEIDSDGHGTRFSHGAGLTDYNFSWNVDLGSDIYPYKFEHVSLAYALLGAPDSILNIWNGYLYRDNFYFSIKHTLEGSKSNAFALNMIDNCSEVKLTDDYTERITEHWGEDQFGNPYGVSLVPDAGVFPHQVITGAKYAANDTSSWNAHYGFVEKSVRDYYGKYWQPQRKYEVKFVDSFGTVRDDGWERLRTLKVGDSGTIVGLDGVVDTQTIISMKYNDITQRIDEMKLGSFIHSSLHQTKFDKLISGDDAAYRRLDSSEKKIQDDEKRIADLEEKQSYFTLIKGDE